MHQMSTACSEIVRIALRTRSTAGAARYTIAAIDESEKCYFTGAEVKTPKELALGKQATGIQQRPGVYVHGQLRRSNPM